MIAFLLLLAVTMDPTPGCPNATVIYDLDTATVRALCPIFSDSFED